MFHFQIEVIKFTILEVAIVPLNFAWVFFSDGLGSHN